MGKKGRRYELNILKEINRGTGGDVICYAPDFSGNSATATTDLAIVSEDDLIHVEAKKRSPDPGNRTVVMDGRDGDDTGLSELCRFVNGTPNFGTPYLLVKFPHREPQLLEAGPLLNQLQRDGEAPDYLDAHLTESCSISMRSEESLQSAQAGQSGVEKLLELVE